MGWDLEQLLPDGLQLHMIAIGAEGVTIALTTTAHRARCPTCDQGSARVHRFCTRTLADLPCFGRRVCLRVRARHFYCVNPACPRKTFSERLQGVARVYARRTERLTAALLGLVYESGGEAGGREAHRLGMPVSGDTLHRIIRRLSLPPRHLQPWWAWTTGVGGAGSVMAPSWWTWSGIAQPIYCLSAAWSPSPRGWRRGRAWR